MQAMIDLFLFFDLHLLFLFFCLWLKAVGFRLWWILFVFRFAASLPILLALVKGGRVQALTDFFCFSTCSFLSHFIAFSLRPSGSSFDGFFLLFDFHLLFPFYWLWFKAVGFRLSWFFFFDLQLLSPFYSLSLKTVGFRL